MFIKEVRMRHAWRLRTRRSVLTISAVSGLLIGVGAWVVLSGASDSPRLASRRPTGEAQLVSVEPMQPAPAEGDMCTWAPASSPERLVAMLQEERASASRPKEADTEGARSAVVLDRPPERVIKDPYATYSAVSLDPLTHEVVLQDENLFQIVAYDHNANTPPTANFTEPKRIIGGHNTRVEFNCALYIDPKNGDIYSVNNDTLDTLVIFDRSVRGDMPPTRQLHTPHRTYGIAADEATNEMFLTVQDPPMVVVYNKDAVGSDKPA